MPRTRRLVPSLFSLEPRYCLSAAAPAADVSLPVDDPTTPPSNGTGNDSMPVDDASSCDLPPLGIDSVPPVPPLIPSMPDEWADGGTSSGGAWGPTSSMPVDDPDSPSGIDAGLPPRLSSVAGDPPEPPDEWADGTAVGGGWDTSSGPTPAPGGGAISAY